MSSWLVFVSVEWRQNLTGFYCQFQCLAKQACSEPRVSIVYVEWRQNLITGFYCQFLCLAKQACSEPRVSIVCIGDL